MTVLALAVSGRRAFWLYKLISSGQPAHDRTDGLGRRIRAQITEVFGQRKLLKWSVPGLAHFFTFWAFISPRTSVRKSSRRSDQRIPPRAT